MRWNRLMLTINISFCHYGICISSFNTTNNLLPNLALNSHNISSIINYLLKNEKKINYKSLNS